jgi:molecular chaperone DnaK (HSP70)
VAGYVAGVDLGTTFTAVAVADGTRLEIAHLGGRRAAIPSVVYVQADGLALTGDAAERRGAVEPESVARAVKRRFGDPTPLLVGGAPFAPTTLLSMLLRGALDQVTEVEGGPPDRVVLTHPATWGPYKLDLLREVAALAEIGDPMFVSEPAAAASYYGSLARVPAGALIAVYDLGGGTFDASVVRRIDSGYVLLGESTGIDNLGGLDVDEAVFAHVQFALGDAFRGLDMTDPAALNAVQRLRAECVEAKEALSSEPDTTIPVALPTLHTEVRLVRAELEQMIRPMLGQTIVALQRALRSANVE